MASLLEVIITFVGAMFVLALVAQSLQEVVKASLGIKGGTRLTAVERLLMEATRMSGLSPTDGKDIFKQIVDKLRALGQPGLRKTVARLDVLDAKALSDLILEIDHAQITGLKGVTNPPPADRLTKVAAYATKWFDLSVNPVKERYRRRMQISAVVAGAVVVLALNADAFWIVRQSRNDPAFRASVQLAAESLSTADRVVESLNDSLAHDTTAADSVWEPLAARRDSAVARRDSLALAAVTGNSPLFRGYDKTWKFSFEWVIGILISALLVGLGAPFWHDLLESLAGFKDRVRARAKVATDLAKDGT